MVNLHFEYSSMGLKKHIDLDLRYPSPIPSEKRELSDPKNVNLSLVRGISIILKGPFGYSRMEARTNPTDELLYKLYNHSSLE